MSVPYLFHVSAHRDFWDWFVVVAAGVAAVGTVLTATSVIATALLFRRRPEVWIRWELDGEPWGKDEVRVIPPGTRHLLMVVLKNVGNATGETTVTNTIAPMIFGLADAKSEVGARGGNDIAGEHTGGLVTFLSGERRFYTNLTWMNQAELTLGEATTADPNVEYTLVFTVEDDRLSTSGKKNHKSRVVPVDERTGQTMERRVIQALPEGEIACGPGYRRSTRRVRVRHAAEGAGSVRLLRSGSTPGSDL